MSGRHRHVWKVESSEAQKSPWEMLNEGLEVTDIERATPFLFVKPLIVKYACSVCGTEKVERV